MRNQKLTLYLTLFMILILLVGCVSTKPLDPQQSQSPRAQALKVLMADKAIYDTTFKSLSLLDKQGKLSSTAKVRAIALGNKYLSVHNLAVQMLLDDGQPSLEGVRAALDAFLAFAGPYTTGVQ
jgi:hypothetical protein